MNTIPKTYSEIMEIIARTAQLDGDIWVACTIVAKRNCHSHFHTSDNMIYVRGVRETTLAEFDVSNGIEFRLKGGVWTFIRKCDDHKTMWSLKCGTETGTVILDELGRPEYVSIH